MLKQHAVQCLDQVSMVQAVKRFVSGFVLEPVVMRPTHTLADLDKLRAATGITTASRLNTMQGLLLQFDMHRGLKSIQYKFEAMM